MKDAETRKNDMVYNLGCEIDAAQHGLTLMAKSGRDDADAHMFTIKLFIETLHNMRADLLNDKISSDEAEYDYDELIDEFRRGQEIDCKQSITFSLLEE